MLYPQYNDPLHIVWRKGDVDDPYIDISQNHKIVNNIAILSEIPDELTGLSITGYAEIKSGSPAANQFIVDYHKGIVRFNSSEESKTVSVDYKGRGLIAYPAERIYLHSEGQVDLTKNLQQVIDSGQSGIDALALIDPKIDEIDTAVSNANTATGEANTARDSANAAANNADSKAAYAGSQGDYAQTQGDYANAQGNYAQAEGDYARAQGDHAQSSVANQVFLGDYSSTIAYKVNNTVRYDHTLYRCIQDSQNNLPTNSAYWVEELSVATELADVQQATTQANAARDNANNSATNADAKANYAQTQGNYAQTQGDHAGSKVTEINTKITEVNTAIAEADTAKNNANISASNADTKAAYAQTQGDYANAQGNYAKAEGDYARAQGDHAQSSVANLAFLGDYVSTTAYKANNTVRYNHALYRCIQDSQNNLPTNTAYWVEELSVAAELADVQQATVEANAARDNANTSAGNADAKAAYAQAQGDYAQNQGDFALRAASGIRHLGDYNSSTAYVVNNSVRYHGSSYICIADCTGVIPTNATHWALMALKGYDGVGNVDSVNGYGGDVVLNATDVGAIDITEKGVNSGVATLDNNGKIPLQQIPDTSRQQTYIVANTTERNGLIGLIAGDKAYETATGDSYIYNGTSWLLLADADWANVNIDWGNITNPPSSYPPSGHNHLVGEITDFNPATKADKDGTLQNNLNAEMVGGKYAADFAQISHTTDNTNPHGVSTGQIGAETPVGAQSKADAAEQSAKDYADSGLSTKVDKVAGKGLSANDYTTAEKTKLAGLSNYDSTSVDDHMANVSNPHGVTAAQVGAAPSSHVSDASNPHNITAVQIGLGSVQNYGIATQAEAEAGTSNAKYMTPKLTAQVIDSLKLEAIVASGTATAIELSINNFSLTSGALITFIANFNNDGAPTTITVNNGPIYQLFKPNTTITPNLLNGKAYTIWFGGESFFLKASAEGNATVSQVLAGKTFSNNNDIGLMGTIPSKLSQTYTPGAIDQTIANGQYLSGDQIILGDADLISKNIVKGKNIFGVHGSVLDVKSGSLMYVWSCRNASTRDYIREHNPSSLATIRYVDSPGTNPSGVGGTWNGSQVKVWSCHGGTNGRLYAHDPNTLAVTQTVHAQGNGIRGAGGFYDGSIAKALSIDSSKDEIYVHNQSTLAVIQTAAISGGVQTGVGGAWDGANARVWSCSYSDDLLFAHNSSTLAKTRTVTAPGPVPYGIGGSWDGTNSRVWSCDRTNGDIYQHNSSSLAVIQTVGVPGSDIQGVGGGWEEALVYNGKKYKRV